MPEDMELVRQYVADKSESAFTEIVNRHVDLVYSAALRQVSDRHLAEEVSQTVFIILARKANSLSDKTILPGWLYKTTRFASDAALKQNIRRQKREHEAYLQSEPETSSDDRWQEIAPVLDSAMKDLKERDRIVLILRFFQKKSMEEVGKCMGLAESAAQKRVTRALEKLRMCFAKRGVAMATTVLATILSATSVQAAPVGLSSSIAVSAVSGSENALTAATLKMIKALATKTLLLSLGVIVTLIGGASALMVFPRSAILPANAVSWWKANGDAVDALSGNNGRLSGGITFSPGYIGKAFNFDGINDHIAVPASPNLNVMSFTLETWILPAEMQRFMPLFEFGVPQGYGGVHFWMNHPGVAPGLFANLRDISGMDHTISSPSGALKAGHWTHIALTFDQPTGSCRIFVNGEVVASTVFPGIVPQTGMPLNLGYRSDGTYDAMAGFRYHGLMDEPTFFDRALTQYEVKSIYRAGKAGKRLGN